jgi:hypothetical protein
MQEPPKATSSKTDDELAEICYEEIQEVLRKHNCKMIVQFTHKENGNSYQYYIQKRI